MLLLTMMANFFLVILLLTIVYISIWFFLSLFLRRGDIADVAWGTIFIMAATSAVLLTQNLGIRSLLVWSCTCIWGLRLSIHIFIRNRNRSEDFRYDKWRQEWERHWAIRSYLKIFLLQGFLAFVISTPVLYSIWYGSIPLTWIDFAGLSLWTTGFYFEATSDYQLSHFKRSPTNKGKIMKIGLWRYSRHPNYFGEVIQWWGLYLICYSTPYGWATIISPMVITFLILKVSGIPMLEKKYESNAEFIKYKKVTSPFIPLPPKKGAL